MKSMNAPLGQVLTKGTKFRHTYDYGSTTQCQLRVTSEHELPLKKHEIKIEARNDPPEFPCDRCGQPAVQICTECVWGRGRLAVPQMRQKARMRRRDAVAGRQQPRASEFALTQASEPARRWDCRLGQGSPFHSTAKYLLIGKRLEDGGIHVFKVLFNHTPLLVKVRFRLRRQRLLLRGGRCEIIGRGNVLVIPSVTKCIAMVLVRYTLLQVDTVTGGNARENACFVGVQRPVRFRPEKTQAT